MGITFKELCCCWRKLLYGQACCMYNCLFSPCVLIIWAMSIYCCGCLRVYMNRGLYKFCCCLCRVFNCCWSFTDKEFPPDESSLGTVGGDSADKKAAGQKLPDAHWVRANTMGKNGKMQL
ncbi:unnamed protein product, partial [Polarella glacialis]